MTGRDAADRTVPEPPMDADDIRAWLATRAASVEEVDDLISGFADILIAAGLPLDRMTSAMPTLHSERRGFGRQWQRGEEERAFVFGWDNRDVYLRSPYYEAHVTRDWVEFRLDETPDERFDIVADLRAAGISHYICVPVFFQGGLDAGITFATKKPDGFSSRNIALLREIAPYFALVMELRGTRLMLDDLLRIYVGEEPKRRILSGEVRRGEVIAIRSAILFADMRGFTRLSMELSEAETADLLNGFYDCVVPAVEAQGGEVLKYIGDGVLAIFRVEENDDARACTSALAAAQDMLDRVTRRRARVTERSRFDVKSALHFGEVAYGNVGSGARLDFTVIGQGVNLASRITVIGQGVNLASRITDLCNTVSRRLLVSSAFAEVLGERAFIPVGEYELRGVRGARQVFEPL